MCAIRTLGALIFALVAYKAMLCCKSMALASSGKSELLVGGAGPGDPGNLKPQKPCCPEGEYSWCACKEDLRSVAAFALGVVLCRGFELWESRSGSLQRRDSGPPSPEKVSGFYAFVM